MACVNGERSFIAHKQLGVETLFSVPLTAAFIFIYLGYFTVGERVRFYSQVVLNKRTSAAGEFVLHNE